jgi:hypothetical protein
MSEKLALEPAAHIALLAPVPLEHLLSGQTVVEEHGRVAFGSDNFVLFDQLDKERKNKMAVNVYIYASHAEGHHDVERTWRARYLGCRASVPPGVHPEPKLRPPSASSDSHWGLFWEVDDLSPVPLQE